MIVDAHVHLWDLQRAPQPWMTDEHAAIARSFLPGELASLLARLHIDAVVLVQGACDDADTDFLFEVAGANSWIAAVTAWVALDEPRLAARRLDELRAHPQLRAVRHLVQNEPDHWLRRPAVLESLALLEQLDLILEVPAEFPRHFDDIVHIAERFPRLRLVVDHLGKPPIGTPAMREWEDALATLAQQGAISAKISGLTTSGPRDTWTLDAVRPSVEHALACFGADRLMSGSDWPVALLTGTYEEVWRMTTGLIEVLAPAEAEALLGETARRLYGLGVSDPVAVSIEPRGPGGRPHRESAR